MPPKPYLNAEGKRVPSVTTIIGNNLGWGKENLLVWANKCGLEGFSHRDIRQQAADTGQLAHTFVEDFIHGRFKLDVPPNTPIENRMAAELALAAFQEWFHTHKVVIHETEGALVSEKFQFGGRYDAVGTYVEPGTDEPILTFFDWKTSKAVYGNYIVQIAAYRYLYEECCGQTVDQAIIVRIGKDGEFDTLLVKKETLDRAWIGFRALLALHPMGPEFDRITAAGRKKKP